MRATLFLAAASAVGPVQKVVTLLEGLKQKVVAEGEVEGQQFQEYSQWCEDESNAKSYAIQTGTTKAAELQADLEQANADITNLQSDVEHGASEISGNDKDLKEAEALRKSEFAEFQKVDKELTDAVDELVRAASILRRNGHDGSAGSAAQLKAAFSQVATGLSAVMNAAFVDTDDKQKLSSLLESSTQDDGDFSEPQAAAYESHSTSIMDTLAELKVKAEKERADLRRDEMNKKHNFDMLKQSLTDQISNLNKDMKTNQASLAKKQEIAGQSSGSLSSTEKQLDEDNHYFDDLKHMCSSKTSEWQQRTKERKEEVAVLQKGIEILSESGFQAAAGRRLNKFMQVKASARLDVRERVAAILQQAAARLHSVGLAQLAVRTRAGDDPFVKVRGLVSDMINRLMSQAAEEADHKSYCDEEIASSKQKRGKLSDRVEGIATRVDAADAGVSKLKEEIASLSTEVAAMDKGMAEATQLRRKENSSYSAAMIDYKAGQESLSRAIGVLQEYFQSKGSSLVQRSPEFGSPIFSGAYEAKVDGAEGIIGILELAASDMSRMEAEAQVDETKSQKDFDKMKNDNEVNRAMKQTAIKNKDSEVARVINLVADLKSDRSGAQSELDAVLEYLSKLKSQCEHKPMTFQERAGRRKQEIESLQEALRILESEAAPAFLQRIRKH